MCALISTKYAYFWTNTIKNNELLHGMTNRFGIQPQDPGEASRFRANPLKKVIGASGIPKRLKTGCFHYLDTKFLADRCDHAA